MSDDVTLTGEISGSDRAARVDWSQIDPRRLLRTDVASRLLGILIALLIMLWPDIANELLSRLIGIAVIVYGASSVWSLRSTRPYAWLRILASVASVGFGAYLVVLPTETATTFGRLTGALLVVKGAWNLLAIRRADRSELGWRVASSSVLIAVGLFVFAYPAELLSTLRVAIAAAWIVVELIALSVLLDPQRNPDDPSDDTSMLVRQWFVDRPTTLDDRRRLYDELSYEGHLAQTKIVRFAMLMVFASVIASMGVIADSTAVVVGAMLIAPLMTPLMAMALSLVMGWPNRLGRSALIAFGGILLAISIGLLLGLAEFTIVDPLANSQIVSRSSPTVVDVVTAIAAGAAGAYGLSRSDVSNSLPGVAIAIALVPPLTVVGISYSQSDWQSGNGALLLFLTNAFAIVLVGGLMFVLLGIAPVSKVTENQQRVRTASAMIVGGAALITGAVMLNGTTVASNLFEQRTVERTVTDWIEPFPDHSTVDIGLDGDTISVVLAGPADAHAPTADTLARRLSSELGREITADIRIRLETRDTSSG